MTSAQNPQDLAPNYAASVFGLTNFFATSSGFLSPLVVSYFTREKVSERCKHFLILILIVHAISEHDERVEKHFHSRRNALHYFCRILHDFWKR